MLDAGRKGVVRLQVSLFVACLLCSTMTAAAQSQPFNVDLMLKAEGVAEVMFGPNGEQLVLEQLAPYESKLKFSWERTNWERDRSRLLSVDKAGVHSVSANSAERIWLQSYSPSGASAAVGWFDGDLAKVGVYEFATRKLKKFDVLLSSQACAFDCPFWISEHEFVLFSVSADQQRKQRSELEYADELTHRWARESWRGEIPAATVLGSGAHRIAEVKSVGTLLRVDVRSGAAIEIGTGLVWEWDMSLSPDRRRLAVLRETLALDVRGVTRAGLRAADQMEMVIYDFSNEHGTVEAFPCKRCNVSRDSLRWSPGGRKLLFASQPMRNGRIEHDYHIYDFESGKLSEFKRGSLTVEVEEGSFGLLYVAPFAWLTDDMPIVRVAQRPVSPAEKPRYEWYALPEGRAPVALTSELIPKRDAHTLQDYVAVHNGKLLVMVDGDLWQITSDGVRRNLTARVADDLSPWCSTIPAWRDAKVPACSGFRVERSVRPVDHRALQNGWLTFRVMRDEVFTGDLLFLNVDDGRVERIEKPHTDAELVAASALAKAAVYNQKGSDGDRLLLVRNGESSRLLLHVNRHLTGVLGGQPRLLTRRETGESEDRYDWLLLPPEHKPGDRHPLLVYFYPEQEHTKQWRGNDLRSATFLNMHLPAARGFAVLFASMRITPYAKGGNPMAEMHEQLLHAAENAVAQGYADPKRWAIIGHSYGGYGVNSVITQTDRFKAAIAIAGVANLTSMYATNMLQASVMGATGNLLYGAMWAEGSQGRMIVPPWQDPARYVENSPLFHAHKITTPLLLLHGHADFVNVSEAEQMFNALNRQGKDALFVRYWGEEHLIVSPGNIRDMWTRIFDWLEQHLHIERSEDACAAESCS